MNAENDANLRIEVKQDISKGIDSAISCPILQSN